MLKLKVKKVNLSSGGSLLVILNKKDADKLDLHALDRVIIKRLKSGRRITAAIDISTKGLKSGEIGFFDEIVKRLKVDEGVSVGVSIAKRPKSIDFLRKKLNGGSLNKKEIFEIMKDITENNLSQVEISYFVAGCFTHGLNFRETINITRATVNVGYKLKLNKKIILDKHCIGGVPGNRTTMVVIPIVAAAGFYIPKTSSRAITSPAGTSDVVEVLAPVKLSHEKVKRVIKKTKACMVWLSSLNPSGVDEALIKVRYPLRLDPEGLLLSSILAKKKAVGATHVLIDIPYGEGSKMNKKQAKILRKKFVKIGRVLGMKIKCILTDGSQPIGEGIGPVFEARDVLSVLEGDGPNDLREKSIFMATKLLEMAGVKKANKKVVEILDSGKAYDKFIQIIRGQGGRKNIVLPEPEFCYSIRSKRDGLVKRIDNRIITKIARIAGAPKDKAAGMYLRVHRGDKVKKKDILFTIYAENMDELEFAKEIAKKNEAVVVG